MINDKLLKDIGLESYETGYYQLTKDLTIDVEGNVRLEGIYETVWIAQVCNLTELKILIEIVNR